MLNNLILMIYIREEASKSKSQSMWLVAPLVAKLPSPVQARVLKVAGILCYIYCISSNHNNIIITGYNISINL